MVLIKSDLIGRYYPLGFDNFYRSVKGEELNFEVNVKNSSLNIRGVELRFDSKSGRSFSLSLTGKDSANYQGKLVIDECSVFRFKAFFLIDGDYIEDNAPFSYLIVDPCGLNNLRIYTLIPSQCGKISQWYDEVRRVKKMGFNAIHLLPISQCGQSLSPYSSVSLKEIDKGYLEAVQDNDEFIKFVDFLVQEKIKLIVDLVLNHVAMDSPLLKEHPAWFKENEQGVKCSGWFEGDLFHAWKDLAKLDYNPIIKRDKDDLWDYMKDYAFYWSAFAAKTGGGIRLDNLHSSYPPFISELLNDLRKEFPDLFFLGELFALEERLKELTLRYPVNLLLATTWEHKFVPQLREYLLYLHNNSKYFNFFTPVTSHDSGSVVQEFAFVESTIPRLAMALFLSTGASGFAQGLEYGVKKKLSFISKISKANIDVQKDFSLVIEKMIDLSQKSVFNIANNILFIDNNHHALIAAIREDKNKDKMLIIINFDTQTSYHFNLREYIKEESSYKIMYPEKDYILYDNCNVEIKPADFVLISLKQEL